MLILVPTPIGNLSDITLRALEALNSCDGIICEDTRRTSLLLNHFGIKKPLYVMNDFNEKNIYPRLLEILKKGQNLCLVSDSGTPLISDPGYKLVRECIILGIKVDSLPGPSSVITALTLSGLPPDKFLFLGYPPEKPTKRITFLKDLRLHLEGVKLNLTAIVFISPYKILKTLVEMRDVFGDIEVVLAHELTKIHQSTESKKISRFLEELGTPKGEYILLFSSSSLKASFPENGHENGKND